MAPSVVNQPQGQTPDFSSLQQLAQMFGSGGGGGQTAGPLGTSTSPVYAPGSFSSPFYLNQIQGQGAQITVGGDLAAILGVPPGPYQMHDLLADFNRLSQSQLLQIQTMLWDGGFYTDASGGPQSTSPTFGAHDNQSFLAFGNALMQAAQQGRSLDDTVMANVAQGVGQAQRSQAMGAGQVGGANVYRIDLTNPADIAYTARTVFQAALGRNPTQAELDKVIGTVQSGQSAQGQAYANVQEGMAQRQFQAQEAARQAARAPQVALGAIPNGPFENVGQWAVAFLRYLQDPVTNSNVSAVIGWADAAGQGLGGNNPLGVTLTAPGATPAGGGPGQAAQNYAQPADGMKAAAQTLGNFPTLAAALKSGDASAALKDKAVQDELNQWSSGAYRNITAQAAKAGKQADAALRKWGERGMGQPAGEAGTPAEVQRWEAQQQGQGQQAPPQGAQTLAQTRYDIKARSLGDQTAPAPQPAGGGGGGGAGIVPPDVLAAYGGNPPPDVVATFQAAQQNPAVAAYLQAQAQKAEGMGTMVPPQNQMGQQPAAPGTTYIPGTTLTDVNAPNPEAASFQAATTGPNRIPYLGYQYLNAFQAIMDMVHSGGLLTGRGGG